MRDSGFKARSLTDPPMSISPCHRPTGSRVGRSAATHRPRAPDAKLDPAGDPFLLETSVPGIFAAGDVRHDVVRRVASAVGQGAVSVHFVHKYLETV